MRQLATHLTFTHNLSTDTFGAMDGVNWSLAVEMQFYLLVALTIGWLDRTPGWRIWLWGTAIAWAWRAGVLWLNGPMDGGLTFVWTTQLPGTLDEFGAGIFLAKLVLDRPAVHRVHGALWLGAAAASGWLAMALYFPRASYWDQPMMVVFWRTSLAAFLLCAVASAVHLPQVLAHRALRPLDQLGEASYGIYLWHLFAIDIVVGALGGGSMRVLGGTLAITLGLALVSWRYLEQPILALARRRTPPGRLAATA